jgi:leucyl/phenylalanyl-tRNA--protein transferase
VPTTWELPDPARADAGDDLIAIGADLQPGTVLAAYRRGLFPMRVRRGGPLGWWSPDPRGVMPLDGLHVSRSLRRSCRRFDVTVDVAFRAVMEACGDSSRPDGWIDESFLDTYTRLHDLGWAHSIEVWADATGERELVGGLYGLAIGALFAGESMFHTATDASKVALVATVDRLQAGGATLFDIQWATPHLTSLGATEQPRKRYLEAVAEAVTRPELTLE